MGLRDSIRNFFYAVTHANKLVNEHKSATAKANTLAAENEDLSLQNAVKTKDVTYLQQSLQSAVRMLIPQNPTQDQLKELYNAVEKGLDRYSITKDFCRSQAQARFGYLDCSNRGREELDKIIYTNTLVSLGVLPRNQEIHRLGAEVKKLLCEELGALDLPKDMPVGKIDYLAPSGKIAETMEFYNAAEFVEQAQRDNYHCGNHMAITVYSDPGTGKHIDTSWRNILDPPPQFQICAYAPPQFTSLSECDIPGIMRRLADNAWSGAKPQTMYIHADENVIELEGYTYEPGYEDFSATASISLNGEVLYGLDSRNVAAYKNETYQTGIFQTLDEALAHIESKVQSQAFFVTQSKKLPSFHGDVSPAQSVNVQKTSLKDKISNAETKQQPQKPMTPNSSIEGPSH